jgi:hypothetical protein
MTNPLLLTQDYVKANMEATMKIQPRELLAVQVVGVLPIIMPFLWTVRPRMMNAELKAIFEIDEFRAFRNRIMSHVALVSNAVIFFDEIALPITRNAIMCRYSAAIESIKFQFGEITTREHELAVKYEQAMAHYLNA